MSAEDFFDEELSGPRRDRKGRPLLIPASGGEHRFPYTRASSMSDYITNLEHVHTWQMRYLARGMGLREDLSQMASAETYTTGMVKDTWDRDQLKANSASGRRLDSIVERALDYVGIHERADRGTAVHAHTEPGARPDAVPSSIEADVASFWAKLGECGIRIWATETFTANDETMSAGTFDHLCEVPGYGNIITDKKNGKLKYGQFAVQLATYANGEVYDWETDERRPLEALCGGDTVNRSVGIIFLINGGKTTLHEVDLVAGWGAAIIAAAARDYSERTDIGVDVTAEVVKRARVRREQLMTDLQAVDTKDEALALWGLNKHLWISDHTNYVKGRFRA